MSDENSNFIQGASFDSLTTNPIETADVPAPKVTRRRVRKSPEKDASFEGKAPTVASASTDAAGSQGIVGADGSSVKPKRTRRKSVATESAPQSSDGVAPQQASSAPQTPHPQAAQPASPASATESQSSSSPSESAAHTPRRDRDSEGSLENANSANDQGNRPSRRRRRRRSGRRGGSDGSPVNGIHQGHVNRSASLGENDRTSGLSTPASPLLAPSSPLTMSDAPLSTPGQSASDSTDGSEGAHAKRSRHFSHESGRGPNGSQNASFRNKNKRRHKKKGRRKHWKHKNRDEVELALRKLFHIDQFRDHQREVIDRVVNEKDTLAVLPTGSGKSLTYQMATVISALRDEKEIRPLTIVVSPLIALMRDQHEKLGQYQAKALQELSKSHDSERDKFIELAKRGFDGVRFDSTATKKQREKILQEIDAGEHSILLITPESLLNTAILARIRKRNVALFVIDEAHCVSKWGHDFRPSYLALKQIAERLGRPPILALTATATPSVQEDIIDQLGMNVDDLPMDDDESDEELDGLTSQESLEDQDAVGSQEASAVTSDESEKSKAHEAEDESDRNEIPSADGQTDISSETTTAEAKSMPSQPQTSEQAAPESAEGQSTSEATDIAIPHSRPGLITTPPNRPNLNFRVEIHRDEMGKLRSLLQHVREYQGKAGIIYCSTVAAVEMVYALLVKANLAAAYYHGQLNKRERDEQHSKFMNSGSNQVVMAATNAFGLGVDKKNTRYVIHYQMPGSMEAYVQEAGRAGRDGKDSDCILLYDEHDLEIQEFFIEQQYPDWGQMKRVARALYAWAWRAQDARRKDFATDDGSVNLANLALAANVAQKRVVVALRRLIDLGLAEEVFPDDEDEDDIAKNQDEAIIDEASLDTTAPNGRSISVNERRWRGIREDVLTEEQLFKEMDNCARIYDRQRMHDMRRLHELTTYAKTDECRSRFIQRYFGVPEDELQPPCGKCDNDMSHEDRAKIESDLKKTVETSPVFKEKGRNKRRTDKKQKWLKKCEERRKSYQVNNVSGGQTPEPTRHSKWGNSEKGRRGRNNGQPRGEHPQQNKRGIPLTQEVNAQLETPTELTSTSIPLTSHQLHSDTPQVATWSMRTPDHEGQMFHEGLPTSDQAHVNLDDRWTATPTDEAGRPRKKPQIIRVKSLVKASAVTSENQPPTAAVDSTTDSRAEETSRTSSSAAPGAEVATQTPESEVKKTRRRVVRVKPTQTDATEADKPVKRRSRKVVSATQATGEQATVPAQSTANASSEKLLAESTDLLRTLFAIVSRDTDKV